MRAIRASRFRSFLKAVVLPNWASATCRSDKASIGAPSRLQQGHHRQQQHRPHQQGLRKSISSAENPGLACLNTHSWGQVRHSGACMHSVLVTAKASRPQGRTVYNSFGRRRVGASTSTSSSRTTLSTSTRSTTAMHLVNNCPHQGRAEQSVGASTRTSSSTSSTSTGLGGIPRLRPKQGHTAEQSV